MDGTSLGSAAFLAIFLMPFVSLIKRDSWSDSAKQALGLGAALVTAFAAGALDGALSVSNWESIVAYFATARVVAETVYSQYFRSTALNARLEAVGNETT